MLLADSHMMMVVRGDVHVTMAPPFNPVHPYIMLRFTDDGQWYRYDGPDEEYERMQCGDTCIVTLSDGLWGYPVIRGLQPKEKSAAPPHDIRDLLNRMQKRKGKPKHLVPRIRQELPDFQSFCIDNQISPEISLILQMTRIVVLAIFFQSQCR